MVPVAVQFWQRNTQFHATEDTLHSLHRGKRSLSAGCHVASHDPKAAVECGAEAQLIQLSGLTQKPQLTHRVSLHFCASPSS